MRRALLLLLLAGPAGAEPWLRETTPTLEATVTLSPGAAVEPGFADFLRSEAQSIVDGLRDEAAEAAKAGPLAQPYRVEVTDRDRFISADYISVMRMVSTEINGPEHPAMFIEGLTVERRTGTLLRLDDILAGKAGQEAMTSIANTLRQGIVFIHFMGQPPPVWAEAVNAATQPDPTVLQNFTLLPSTEAGRIGGLAFHFSQGEVTPGPGAVSVTIPQAVFAAGLNPAVAARFGGAPVTP